MPIEPDPAAGSDKGNRHDVRFAHGGNLESEEIGIAGLFGRDQVNLRTARPEIVQDSGQLDLLDAVSSDSGDLPSGMEVGVVGRQHPDIADRAALTLSSPTKASLFPIILWRCWAGSEHGIARPRDRTI